MHAAQLQQGTPEILPSRNARTSRRVHAPSHWPYFAQASSSHAWMQQACCDDWQLARLPHLMHEQLGGAGEAGGDEEAGRSRWWPFRKRGRLLSNDRLQEAQGQGSER